MASFSQPAEHCGALSKLLPATGSHSNRGEGVIRFDEYIGLRHYPQHMHFLHAFFHFTENRCPSICMYMVCSVGHQQNEMGTVFLTCRLDCDFSLLLKKKICMVSVWQ